MSLAVTLVIVPCLLAYVFTRELFEYQTENFNKNWSYIFKDIKTDSKYSSSYFILYISRRIAFVSLVFYSVDVPTYQRLVMYNMNLFMFLYIGTNPLKSRIHNKIEQMNEMVVCLVSLHMNFFTDWVSDPEVQEMYGWSMIAIILIQMTF